MVPDLKTENSNIREPDYNYTNTEVHELVPPMGLKTKL